MYSGAACGKREDQTHRALDGTAFHIDVGAFVLGERAWPGEAEECKCFMKIILPGFS